MAKEELILAPPTTTTLSGAHVSYNIERRVQFTHGFVEVGNHRWSCPIEDVVTNEDDVFALDLALTPRPSHSSIVWLNPASSSGPRNISRILLINPGTTFRLSIPSGHVRTMYCSINRLKFEEAIGMPANLDELLRHVGTSTITPVIELLLNRIYQELRERKFASERAIDSYASALCVELARCFRESEQGSLASHKGGLSPWRMRLLHERLHAEAPAPRLSELANLCGMSVRQLSRAFKIETGKTLGTFINEEIIERANRLLTQTDHSISEIAMELGFATPASFTYSFRCSTGILPSELRRMNCRSGGTTEIRPKPEIRTKSAAND